MSSAFQNSSLFRWFTVRVGEFWSLSNIFKIRNLWFFSLNIAEIVVWQNKKSQSVSHGNFSLVLYRVWIFRVRVEYESEGVEYESSTSRVLRIHSKKLGSSL